MKKILMLILSVIMTVSFSMFAFVACNCNEPEHTHTWGEWTYNGDGTHTRTCSGDATHKETANCAGNKNCSSCGAKLPYTDGANESVGDYVPDVVVTDLYFVAGTVQMTVGTTKNTMPQGIVAGETVEFTSSNPEIATVDAVTGTVYAVKEGQTTITVSNAGRQASYLVSVSLGGMAPQIYFESLNSQDLTVALGEQLNLLPIIKFSGEYYNDITVEYDITDTNVGSIDDKGVFTPNAVGTTEVTVNVGWRDVVANELTCTLVVTVVADTHFVLNGGRTNVIELYLTESHGGIEYVTEQVANVVAYEGVTEKDVTLEVIDENGIVNYDAGTKTISAAKAGDAILRASFEGSDGNTVSKDFAILVKKPIAVYSEKVENFSTAFGILPTDTIFGYDTTIVEAYQNDRALQVEDGKVFDIRVATLYATNDVELVVYDDKCGYVLDVEAYYAYITTPEEFIEAFKNPFTADLAVIPTTGAPLDEKRDYAVKQGYMVLANDLDMTGYTLDNAIDVAGNDGKIRTFYMDRVIYTGTFDGQGHIIKNLTFTNRNKYGLFGTMKAANVKNVAFENVVFEAGATGLSVLGYEINSTACYVENVYIKVAELSDPATGNQNAALFFGNVFSSLNLSNIIVELPNITNEEVMLNRGGALFGNGRTSIMPITDDVYVITNQKIMGAYEGTTQGQSYLWLAKGDENHLPHIGTDVVSATNIRLRRYVFDGESPRTIGADGTPGSYDMTLLNRYDSYINMYQAGNNYDNFNSYYWDKSSGIPVFKGISLGEDYAYLGEEEVTVNAEDGYTARLFSNVLTDNVVWTSSDETVATVEDGVLTILKTGTTTISVNVNDGQFEDSCVVNVVLSETPEIVVDDLNFYTGDEFRWANTFVENEWDFDPKLIYADTTYTEEDELVSFAYEISDPELGTFDEYGVFTASTKVGTGVVTVSATIYGETFTYQFEIRVTGEIAISINDVEDTTYPEIELFSSSEWGGETFTNTADFIVKATLGGAEYNASIVSSDENVVKYEDGKLIAQSILGYQAEAEIFVSVVDNGVTVNRTVKVIVTKPAVESEITTETFSTEDGMFYDRASGEFKALNTLFDSFGDITAASQGETELEVEDNSIFGVELTQLTGAEDVTFNVYNINGGYIITVKAYTNVITSKEEFWSIFGQKYTKEDIAGKLELKPGTTQTSTSALNMSDFNYTVTGSYILETDIELTSADVYAIPYNFATHGFVNANGVAITGTTYFGHEYMTFTGTFDGNGHTINGFYSGTNSSRYGMFGMLVDATVKNVGFTNVSMIGSQSAVVANSLNENSAIENVYIQTVSTTNYRVGAIAQSMANGRYENIIVEFPLLNAGAAAQPVGEAAKDSTNWVNVEGYVNETAKDQGGGVLSSGYEIPSANISNVIVISETQALITRYGLNYFFFADSDRALFQNEDGSWKTDAEGVSYGDYFTLKDGATIKGGGIQFVEGVTRFNSLEEMGVTTGVDYSAFTSDLWDMSTGIPQWKTNYVEDWRDIANDEYVTKTVNGETSTAGEGEVDVTLGHEGETSSAVLGINNALGGLDLEELRFEATNGDLINLDEATGAISYKEGVTLPVTETVTAYFKIGGREYTRTFTIVVDYTMQEVGEIVFDASTDVLDLSWLAAGENATSVTFLGEGENVLVDGKIELENNTDRVVYKDVHITTDLGNHYKATLAVYTKIIYNAEEFVEIFWTPEYHITQTHSITYKGTTYTETFNDIDNPEMLYKNGTTVYMNLSDDFIAKLADGATRNADSTVITAVAVTGAYMLGADIEALGSNGATYGYQYSPKTVTKTGAGSGSVTASSSVVWGSNSYDKAGYKLAGTNAYLLSQVFSGVFDGNGYSIKGFETNTQGGLFGTLNNAIIKNVAITGVTSGAAGASSGVIAYANRGEQTAIENVYVEILSVPASNRFGVTLYDAHASNSMTYTMKDVVIVMPDTNWDYTAVMAPGVLGSSTGSNHAANPVTENVVVISATDVMLGYGHGSAVATREVWVAENDASLIEVGGKYDSTVIGNRAVQIGMFRYADLASAISAGKTAGGNWTITAEGIVWAD